MDKTLASTPKRVLVTGSVGFLGRALSAALRRNGFSVIGIDRKAGEYADYALDLCDANAVKNFAQDIQPFDAIIHLAALLPGKATSREEFLSVNVDASRILWEHLLAQQTHGIFLSTGLVYGPDCHLATEENPLHPAGDYPQSKALAETEFERIAAAKNAQATILRPSVLYGIGANPSMLIPAMLQSLAHDAAFPMTAGAQWRDFLYIDDAVRAIVLLVQQKVSGIFNLSSGEVVSVARVAELVGEITGKKHLLRLGELPYRAGESFYYSLNNQKLKTAIPWSPQISLEQGLRILWEHIQASPRGQS